jgi:hypothetical protein
VLALEGDPEGAAAGLGMSHVIRGEFDHGEPELRALVDRLTERLGEEGYGQAYRLGAEMPRQAAIDRVAGLVLAGQEAALR